MRNARPTLFREEALAFHQHHRQWGDVVLLQPVSTTLLSWGTVAIVALILLFLCFTQYARKETVPGYLSPAAGTARVMAAQPGIVQNVYIEEGQAVQAGAALLSVEVPQITVEGDDVNTTVLNVATRKREMLRTQIAADEHRVAAEQVRLAAQAPGSHPHTSSVAGTTGWVTSCRRR